MISAYEAHETEALVYKIAELLKTAPKIVEKESTHKTYTLEQTEPDFIITVAEDGVFELTGAKLKLIFERTDFTKDEAVKRFARQLRSMGVDEALREKGAKNEDTIRIFNYEFEFIE